MSRHRLPQSYVTYPYSAQQPSVRPQWLVSSSTGEQFILQPSVDVMGVALQQTVKPPRRNNSERSKKYRRKKNQYVDTLTRQVEALRKHVLQLETTKLMYEERLFSSPFTSTGSAIKFVKQYNEIFKHGLHPRKLEDGTMVTPVTQRAYLTSLVHPLVVAYGDCVGIEPLMEQWGRYTNLHSAFYLEYLTATLTMSDNCAQIRTTGMAHLRYTRTTIVNIYPHVLAREDLVQRLIGKEIHLPFTDHFYFNKKGQLREYDLNPDFVTALYDALGNLEDVAILIGSALMRKGALVEPNNEIEMIEEMVSTDSDSQESKQESIQDPYSEGETSAALTDDPETSSVSTPSPSRRTMNMEYILS